MSWIDKIKSKASIKKDPANTDLWAKCLGCEGNIYIYRILKKIYGYVLNATTTSEQAQSSESTN